MQLAQRGEHGFAVVHDDRLGHLELEPVRRNSRARQRADHHRYQLLAAELGGRQVDRDLQIGRPRRRLRARRPHHPGADRHDQTGFLRERDEVRWRYQAALRVMPAQQRLATADGAALEIGERLVIKFEFAVGERAAQLTLQRPARLHQLVQLRLEEAEGAASAVFRAIEREVGAFQDFV